MLNIPFVAFWIMVGWGLYDGDLYPKEAAVFVGIWVVLFTCFMLLNLQPVLFIVPTVILDIVLILKVFGGDVKIR